MVPASIAQFTRQTANWCMQKQYTVRHVLRGHLWDKEKVVF